MLDTFDPFTPHIHLLSLGGIRVHEGAWTAFEILKTLSEEPGDELIAYHQIESRLYAQFNGIRLTWESSLLGLSHAQHACILVDARYSPDWIERSVQRAIDELFIWHKAKQRQQKAEELSVFIWVELPHHPQEKNKQKSHISRALIQLNRTIQLLDIQVLDSIESICLSTHDPKDIKHYWSQIYYTFSNLGMIEHLDLSEESEQVEYIDAFVLVPSGTFYQGGPRLAPSPEKPRHQVKLSNDFWVSQTPITKRFWTIIMADELERLEVLEVGDEPVVDITWFAAVRFCNCLSLKANLDPAYIIEDHDLPKVEFKRQADGYRLLTESEWEYATLGGFSTSLTTAPPPPAIAWTQERSQLAIHPVAQLDPNAWGLYDCLGNVAEWCQDVYRNDVYAERKKQRLSLDPCVYSGAEGERVVRGGAFDRASYLVNHYHREAYHPKASWSSVGFRVMRPQTDRSD